MFEISIESIIQEIGLNFRNRQRGAVVKNLTDLKEYVLDFSSGPTVPLNVVERTTEFVSDLDDLIELVDRIDINFFDDVKSDFNDRLLYYTKYVLIPWLSKPDVQARLQQFKNVENMN